MTDATTIVIADDHPLFRRGLIDALEGDPSLRIVGEASDGDAALALIRRHRPRIALLDIQMPGTSGLAVAEAVLAEQLDVSVVMLTMSSDSGTFHRALDLGVKGYVLKDSAVNEISACLHMVAAGRAYISPALSGHLLNKRDEEVPALETVLAELTVAERRVLQLIARGCTSAEIAEYLGNSPKTIENHRSHVCRKLNLSGPHALLRYALAHKELGEETE
jgi:DNA-binding NarL/FixJ family response regulator